ncbi:MAG: hypothetical protein J6Q81_02495, partial [Lentisphaeria bacterium]|nr:hypothetical protein [Lentisphaeria bacterium]
MIGKFITLLLISATCVLSAADFVAERYTKVKNVELQSIYSRTKSVYHTATVPVNDSLPVIILDEDIYRQLNNTATNIAVVSQENQLIPFVREKLYKWKKRVKYAPVSGKIVGFTVNKERNEAIIDYQLNSAAATQIGKLALHPYGRKKFNKTVTLEFDNQTKVENLKFFNHQSVVDFSRHTFEFTPAKTRNIRVIITPFAEKHSDNSALIRSGNKDSFSETQVFTDELSLNQITFYQAETQLYPARELTQIKTFPTVENDKID